MLVIVGKFWQISFSWLSVANNISLSPFPHLGPNIYSRKVLTIFFWIPGQAFWHEVFVRNLGNHVETPNCDLENCGINVSPQYMYT